MRKPNALKAWSELEKIVRTKRVAIFLDYDGTLTPIIDIPSEAKISNEVRNAVEMVSHKFPTAIITGRSITTVTGFVKLDSVYYAGSHGFDIRSPGGKEVILQIGQQFLPLLKEAYKSFQSNIGKIPGSLIEDNQYSVSVHYRLVDKKHWANMEATVDAYIAKSGGKLKKGHGKMVIEVRANCEWDKGKAVRALLNQLSTVVVSDERRKDNGKLDSEKTEGRKRKARGDGNEGDEKKRRLDVEGKLFPIYLGDDTTDEDAFRELQESKNGVGIRVLSKGSSRDQKTGATYVLESVEEVRQFLEKLIKI